MTHIDQLAGLGGTDPACIRWAIAARVELATETHHGYPADPLETELDVDQPLVRDHLGRPYLPFTTLRGLLAHYLTDRLVGYDAPADACAEVQQLFGSQSSGSALSGDPMIWQPPPGDGPTVMLRSHTRVDPATGTSAPGALWTVETLPVGSHGLLLLSLATTPDDETRLLSLLDAALVGFGDPIDPIRIGSRTVSGAGHVTVTGWAAQRHDLSTEAGYLAWYTPSWDHRRAALQTGATHQNLLAAITAATATGATGADDTPKPSLTTIGDQRRVDVIDLQVSVGTLAEDNTVLPGLLRVADQPPPDHTDVDLAHRTVPIPGRDGSITWTPVLGGEGLHAWLRTHATRIAHSLTRDPHAADELVAAVFGDPPTSTGAPRPGHLFVTDEPVTNSELVRRGRAPLDPVFGAALPHRLFTELVLTGGTARVQLLLRCPTDAHRGLLAHTLLDAREWALQPLGGGGHGHLTIVAATHTIDALGDTPTRLDLFTAHPPTDEPCRCPDPRHAWQAALQTPTVQEP